MNVEVYASIADRAVVISSGPKATTRFGVNYVDYYCTRADKSVIRRRALESWLRSSLRFVRVVRRSDSPTFADICAFGRGEVIWPLMLAAWPVGTLEFVSRPHADT